jgi:hypothetical protein
VSVAVEPPTVALSPLVEAPDAGVIEDARLRHRRHRRLAVSWLLAGVIVGLVIYAALGAQVHAGTPASVKAAAGAVQPLDPSAHEFWVTPDLFPGNASLDTQAFDGQGSSWYTCCGVYVGPGVPIGDGGPPSGGVRAPLPVHADPNYLMFVAAGVASVRVGSFGVVEAHSAPGLPPGDRVVAFQVPRTARAKPLLQAPLVKLTALGSRGQPIATNSSLNTAASTGPWAPVRAWTEHGGRCAVASSLSGLADEQTFSSKTIVPLPHAVPGLFLSCLEDKYGYRGSKFTVAILLNAHNPAARPAALWGTTALAGDSGAIEIKPPPQFPTGQNSTSPLFARRDGNAWLVVQARPGFAPNPGFAQTVHVLNSIHITRTDLSKTSQ